MVIDSSAVVAVLCQEEGHEAIRDKLIGAEVVLISAPSILEAAIVVTSKQAADGISLVNAFLTNFGIEVVPFTRQHSAVAFDAFHRWGKGRHPAALNICDCISYATAKSTGEPLLYVGSDFARTDIEAA